MTEAKRALITGVGGQDGSWLADLLVAKGYEVHGLVRRHAVPGFPNIQHLLDKDAITLHEADLGEQHSIDNVVAAVRPEEVYNLAAQSHVASSFSQPELTLNITGLGALRVFEAVRRHAAQARVFQASSSEMFGNRLAAWGDRLKLDESHPFSPASPYGAGKVLAHEIAHVYRESYGLHISCGIMFNHESERRGPMFLTRKITLGLARLQHGLQRELVLGNLDAQRDWGYAPEYTEGAWRMLQEEKPGDWVLATGEAHSVQEFLHQAMVEAGMDPTDERRIVSRAALRRPTDIARLIGNPAKAKAELGWGPGIRFADLVRIMVKHDFEAVAKEAQGAA